MIRRSHLILASILLLSGVVCLSGQQPREPVHTTFERLAREIVVLGPDQFIFGFRGHSRIPTKELAPVKEFTLFLENGKWQSSDFLPLLKHNDPKVRTLALVALYSLEDPKVLPEIFPLVTDEAVTFVSMRHLANFYALDKPLTAEMTEPQTVGKIATSILNAYLESGGYYYGPLGLRGQPGFKEYWKAHAGRSTSAGWWRVRLARAGHETSPTPAGRYAPIKRLRAEIDKLPEPDRAYTLLRLNRETNSEALVSPAELIALLKKLGPDSLLDLLKRKIRSDDPDLQPEVNNGPHGSMAHFILQNSSALLRPADAPALLAQEVVERDFQNNPIVEPLLSPWWAIGAAQLNHKEADSILKLAYARFQGEYDGAAQLELAHALWRLVGESQATTVADWIYNELAKPMGMESYRLDAMLRTNGRRNPILAKALIEDPRFDELNWKSLEVLAKAINSWNGREIVPVQEMESAWSPMGVDFFMRDKERGLKQYPKEIGELSRTLSRWRQAMRESVRP